MKTSPFQIGIIIFFVIFVVVAMLIFTGVIGGDKNAQKAATGGSVVMWGTYPQSAISNLISEYKGSNPNSPTITYVPIQSGDLDTKLAEAIASGRGPDVIVIGQDEIIKNRSKLYAIPYAQISEATFRSTFAGEGELFMLPDGIVGLPLTIDPLILYYNRDLLEGAGVTIPPKTWTEVANLVPALTKKNTSNSIIQSAIPFGIYGNLNNAVDILSLLLLQAGNPIVSKQGAAFISVLATGSAKSGSQSSASGEAIVNFFTQFVDPTKETYTWNRSFTDARSEFIKGELAFYIGYASELPTIVDQNPNLNFDVTKVPQPTTSGTQVTYGNIKALAIIKASKNPAAALATISNLTGAEFSAKLVEALNAITPVAPARRDLLGKVPQNLFAPTLYSSAIIARGWYSPGRGAMDPIFNAMIDSVVRGAATSADAIQAAQSKLTVIFGQ